MPARDMLLALAPAYAEALLRVLFAQECKAHLKRVLRDPRQRRFFAAKDLHDLFTLGDEYTAPKQAGAAHRPEGGGRGERLHGVLLKLKFCHMNPECSKSVQQRFCCLISVLPFCSSVCPSVFGNSLQDMHMRLTESQGSECQGHFAGT
eukprot:1159278-Pelagomonas_calceolata.AAC.8